MIRTVQTQEAACSRCGFRWKLRKVVPKTCGRCKSRLWNDDQPEPTARQRAIAEGKAAPVPTLEAFRRFLPDDEDTDEPLDEAISVHSAPFDVEEAIERERYHGEAVPLDSTTAMTVENKVDFGS